MNVKCEYSLLDYNTMQFRDIPTFPRYISSPSSGSKVKHKKWAEAGVKLIKLRMENAVWYRPIQA
jgi:hypothetical protein